MAEPRADDNRSVGGPVHQLQRHHLVAGELEHGQTCPAADVDSADLLPTEVRERRDKLGFVTPEQQWFRGALGSLAVDVFASRSFCERGFVEATAARKQLDRHRRGEAEAGMELWRALNVELWARTSLDR